MIRPARADDVPAIAALEIAALGADAWSEALIAEGVDGRLPTVIYLVAERGEAVADHEPTRVAGYAAASIVGDVAELQRIAVGARDQRRGVASGLLGAVTHEATIRHADRLLLEVREDNESALKFYAAAGFVELDRRLRYYADGTHALVLAREVPDE